MNRKTLRRKNYGHKIEKKLDLLDLSQEKSCNKFDSVKYQSI